MGMNFTIDELEKLMEDLDADKDGFINWKDFLKAVSE
jgi:Ca2+-binding EF-hand superfamily protein